MLKDLLYLDEHLSCSHYVADYRSCFKYKEIPKESVVEQEYSQFNFLVFVLHGEVSISYGPYRDRRFRSGEIAFLPKSVEVSMHTVSRSRMLSCVFDVPDTVCDKMVFKSLWKICQQIEYNFAPTLIHPRMKQFLDLLTVYLENGIDCEHLHALKQQELFLVFRWFYTREELAKLFYPMIGESLDFKSIVLENYAKVASVGDLARLAGMSRSSFDTTFKDVFGLSARQWMLRQTARHVRYQLTKPDTTISEVMGEFGFNSFTHFNRFCKQQFGCSPSQLIKELRA